MSELPMAIMMWCMTTLVAAITVFAVAWLITITVTTILEHISERRRK